MPRRLLRALAITALVAGAATGTAGCATACPAIAHLNAVAVDSGAFPDVVAVQFCVEGKCSPAPGADAASATNLYAVTPQDDGSWSLAFDMATPDTVEVRLFDAEGTLIHESEQTLAWTHAGGACSGPSNAEPLVLTP